MIVGIIFIIRVVFIVRIIIYIGICVCNIFIFVVVCSWGNFVGVVGVDIESDLGEEVIVDIIIEIDVVYERVNFVSFFCKNVVDVVFG